MSDWILTTGFGVFPGVQHNPTEQLTEQLDGLSIEGVKLNSAIFNVSFERSAQALKELLRERSSSPLAMIHFGVASSSTQIRIERRAINCKSAEIPDVDGVFFKHRPIDENHDVHMIRETALDVGRLVADLKTMGIPVCESNDAGRYVCNNIYFHSLQYAQELISSPASLFVHVPSIGVFFEQDGKRIKWTERLLFESAKHIVRWVVCDKQRP